MANQIKPRSTKPKKALRIILLVLLAALVLCGGFAAAYVNDYYHAEEIATQAMTAGDEVEIGRWEDGTIVFQPQTPAEGLIFYPGGKVEYNAYAPLMRACAQRGILCVLVKMPCNLAVLNANAADGIVEQFPQVERWYIGGHSLGGAMAASYAAKHSDTLDGLILLAAYSTADLADTDIAVLSLYGSEDGVLNREKYQEYQSNLPENAEESILQGGCHAYFGSYGAQDGDGIPTITNEQQVRWTADNIAEWIDRT